MCRLYNILHYYPHAFIRPEKGKRLVVPATPLQTPTTCPRQQPVSDSAEEDDDDCCAPDNVALGRVDWQKCLCRCATCQELYRTSFCPWVFEEIDDTEDKSEPSAPQPVEESESFAPTMLEQQAFGLFLTFLLH